MLTRNLFATLLLLLPTVGCGGDDAGQQEAEQVDNIIRTIYVHGLSRAAEPTGWDYWGDKKPGLNAVPVNWGGQDTLANSNKALVEGFDRYCKADSSAGCFVVCHSAGCPQVGYTLSRFGTTEGDKPRWRIFWVAAAGSAAGGSELANLGYRFMPFPLIGDLRPSVVRSLYDHSDTAGVPTYMLAGARSGAQSSVLPGEDDGAVAYHSAGGTRDASAFCNEGDYFCRTVLPVADETVLHNDHWVILRDDTSSYTHFLDDDEGPSIAEPLYNFAKDNATAKAAGTEPDKPSEESETTEAPESEDAPAPSQ